MAVWLELHCDALRDGVDNCGRCSCFSKRGDSPGSMAANSAAVAKRVYHLQRQAKQDGWRLDRNGWTCPACLKDEATQSTTQQGTN